MWRHVTAAVPFFCLAYGAQAQSLQTNAPDSSAQAVGAQSSTATPRGVNVYGTLNPQPPTGTANQITSQNIPAVSVNAASTPGFNVGSVTVLPGVTAATFFDDNVFALPVNRLSDWAFVLRPEISWHSNNWNNLELGGNAYVEGRKYVTYQSEDQINGGASIGGTAAVGADTQVVGRMQYVHGHEERGVSTTITEQFLKPIAFDQGEAALAVNNRWDRIWSSVGANALLVHYDDADLPGGISVSQAYRNGNVERLPVRLGYVVAPLTSIFVEASGNRRDFDINSYDSTGYRVVAGLLLEPGEGARVRGEVFAGYMNQHYNGLTFQPISTWTAGGSMAFLATDQLTLSVEGRRDAREASLSGGVFALYDGVSIIESVATARADYRVLPNVTVGGGASYIQDSFLMAGRTDWAWSPLASLKYYVTPRITVGFDYRHVDFKSSGLLVPNYTRNVYLISANVQF